MTTLERLQLEMKGWQRHNFADRPEWLPLMGAFEELGELVGANRAADIADAIGDVVIYLADYGNANKYDLQCAYDLNKVDGNVLYFGVTKHIAALTIELGKLAHSHIKLFQHIRLDEPHEANACRALGRALRYLDEISTDCLRRSLDSVIEEVWARVSKRDWKADPTKGNADAGN